MNAVKESNPEVGSSNNITVGSVTNSTPIEVLFLSPPDSPFNNRPPTYILNILYHCMLTSFQFKGCNCLFNSPLLLLCIIILKICNKFKYFSWCHGFK